MRPRTTGALTTGTGRMQRRRKRALLPWLARSAPLPGRREPETPGEPPEMPRQPRQPPRPLSAREPHRARRDRARWFARHCQRETNQGRFALLRLARCGDEAPRECDGSLVRRCWPARRLRPARRCRRVLPKRPPKRRQRPRRRCAPHRAILGRQTPRAAQDEGEETGLRPHVSPAQAKLPMSRPLRRTRATRRHPKPPARRGAPPAGAPTAQQPEHAGPKRATPDSPHGRPLRHAPP